MRQLASMLRGRLAVKSGQRVHFVGRQLVRNLAHLLVNVILPHVLSEGRELTFDVLGMLTPQRRRTKFLRVRAVTGRAGRYSPLRIASKSQADTGVMLPQTAATLRNAFTGDRQQSIRLMGEIGGHVGGILLAQRGSDGVHGAPKPLARTVIVELLVDYRRIHARQRREEVDAADAELTMAAGAGERDDGAVFLIAGRDARP